MQKIGPPQIDKKFLEDSLVWKKIVLLLIISASLSLNETVPKKLPNNFLADHAMLETQVPI